MSTVAGAWDLASALPLSSSGLSLLALLDSSAVASLHQAAHLPSRMDQQQRPMQHSDERCLLSGK